MPILFGVELTLVRLSRRNWYCQSLQWVTLDGQLQPLVSHDHASNLSRPICAMPIVSVDPLRFLPDCHTSRLSTFSWQLIFLGRLHFCSSAGDDPLLIKHLTTVHIICAMHVLAIFTPLTSWAHVKAFCVGSALPRRVSPTTSVQTVPRRDAKEKTEPKRTSRESSESQLIASVFPPDSSLSFAVSPFTVLPAFSARRNSCWQSGLDFGQVDPSHGVYFLLEFPTVSHIALCRPLAVAKIRLS